LDVVRSNLDSIDILSLSGCTVQATAGKYNTSLGRQAKPSQRLLLELEYLRRAPSCIARLRDHNRDALAETLNEARLRVRQQLPELIFNATLGSDEYQSFWRTNRAARGYPRVGNNQAETALNVINHHVQRWLSGDYRAHNRDLEVSLSEVAGGDAARLLQAYARQRDCMAAITKPINQEHPAFLTTITALETQLATWLPLRYKSWMDVRDHRLKETTCTHRAHGATPCPKARELVTLMRLTAITHYVSGSTSHSWPTCSRL
jgi:hypothetical protein